MLIGRTGFVAHEVVGIGINNPEATITMPEGLFLELLAAFGQAAYEKRGVADILGELRRLGEKYGDKALGDRLAQGAKAGLSSVWSEKHDL